MRKIHRQCRCKTWDDHLESEKCEVNYDLAGPLDSYDEWDEGFADKWNFEYDPEEYFAVPEAAEVERDPHELAIARGDLFAAREHPNFLRAMSARLNNTEDEVVGQFIFDGKSPDETAKYFGVNKLAVLRCLAVATYEIQDYFGLAPRRPSNFVVIPQGSPHREGSLSLAA